MATVVITTKNRCADLKRALQSCIVQEGNPEILVVDDGSTDGTGDMVAELFPAVKLIRNDNSTGYIVARNLAATMATGDVIFSIDDDAEFTTPYVVQQTLIEFDHDKVGAVAIPYTDVKKNEGERQRTPDSKKIYITDRFIGTAHALRKDLFLKLGSYRKAFFHQGEEGDYCLRMLNFGYLVRCGNSDRINHYESPKRDTRRMDIYGRRNDILSTWLNVPTIYLPMHLFGVVIKGFIFGVKQRTPLRTLFGISVGFAGLIRHLFDRSPVSVEAYCLNRRLRKLGAMSIDGIKFSSIDKNYPLASAQGTTSVSKSKI